MQLVPDEVQQVLYRTALDRRREELLAGEAVLVVRDDVAEIRDEFHQEHPEIGGRAVGPLGKPQRRELEHGIAQ